MARVLIVGCGCRGSALAADLLEQGHAVRGTTRRTGRLAELEEQGIEPVLADPDRLGTLLPQLEGVSVLCWLMGSAAGPAAAVAALHDERLHALLETLVDTHVRGFVYERAGTVDPIWLARGDDIARRAEQDRRIRLAMIDEPPSAHDRWLADAARAVGHVLSR